MSASGYEAPRLSGSWPARLRVAAVSRQVPAQAWVLGGLLIAAAVIRILTVDNQSFWMDEALTAYEAHLPLGAMLHTVANVETTPPLYFVIIWAWAKVFGTSEVALRSVSLLAGVALVPIAYLAARELVSRWAGVIAGALVAVNPFLIWYSQEARAYMLLAALTGASFLWFIRCRKEPSTRNLAWWAVFSSLAVMTHFFAGFAIAPEAIWLLWLWRTRATAIAAALVAASQAAMLPLALLDASHGTNWIAGVPRTVRLAGTLLEWAISLLYRRTPFSYGLIGGAALLVILVGLLSVGGNRDTRAGALPGAVIVAFVMLTPLALGLAGQDYFLSRNVIPAFIPLVTVVAAACVAPRARVLGVALLVGLVAIFSIAALRVQTKPYLQRPDWRSAARVLGATEHPRAILVAAGSSANALKIYLPHVNWVQPPGRRVWISEIDVYGSRARVKLAPAPYQPEGLRPRKPRTGSPLPTKVPPPGARLLSQVGFGNWLVARYALSQPVSVSVHALTGLAPRYFRRTPKELLVFIQQPGR